MQREGRGKLYIVKEDISLIEADAIVNSTDRDLSGADGVDYLLHSLGGEEFEKECDRVRGRLRPGEAVYTKGGGYLPCEYVIHTCGPHWNGGFTGEAAILKSCYKESLKAADDLALESVAMPLISAGFHGYPIDTALEIAVKSINEYLEGSDLKVTLAIYGEARKLAGEVVVPGLEEAMSLLPVEAAENRQEYAKSAAHRKILSKTASRRIRPQSDSAQGAISPHMMLLSQEMPMPEEPEPGESFRDMVIRLTEERNMTDPEVYNKAGITRAAYNKIINGKTMSPSRQTVAAIGMALELSYKEACELMEAAGLAFSKNNPFDIIVSNCFRKGFYDIWKINVALSDKDLPILGSNSGK